MPPHVMHPPLARWLGACCLAGMMLCCPRAYAWGDEGHEVIGLIADHFLTPPVRARVQSLLAGDATQLTARDIAHESTWADKYRDSDRNGSKVRYNRTRIWHYVDAQRLIAQITPSERARWSVGTPDDWAMESHAIAKARVYGPLPASPELSYALSPGYVADATRVTAEQLSKAAVRLAWVLNQALQ